MFRPSRNFKVPLVYGGQWKDHQTFQKWDPISKRLVQVACCGPIEIGPAGPTGPSGPTGPTGPCPPPDPVDSVSLFNLTKTSADVSWVYGGSETIFDISIYEGSSLPVNTGGTPVFNIGGPISSPYTASFTLTDNYYYIAGVRVKNDCGYSSYVYSDTVQNSTGISDAWTFTARGSNRAWTGVALSNDGTKIAATVTSDQIYTSTDGGATWTARDSSRQWDSIDSSSDGTKLIAAVNGGRLYTSTDSGATWTARDSNRNWSDVASSSDGTKLVATVSTGQIYTSTDSGATWTARDSNRNWISVASSSDGTKLIAAEIGGRLYTSTDSGVNWTMGSLGSKTWVEVACSADGSIMVGAPSFDKIYVSTDSGATWTGKDSSRDWYGVTCSSDGTVMAASVNLGQLYISTDTGNTWTAYESNRAWNANCTELSGNGLVLADGVGGSKMYVGVYQQPYQFIKTSGGIGSDPGSGNFNANITTPPNVVLQFNKTDKNTNNANTFLSTISGSANVLTITKDVNNYSTFSISGSTDVGSYWSFSCSIISFLGVVNNGDTITLTYS